MHSHMQKYSSNKIVKDNHIALYYRNILLAVDVIISYVCIEIYRGPLSWPPRQARLVQVISKCLIYTATHFFFTSAIAKSHVRMSFITCTRYKRYRSVYQRRCYVLLPWYIFLFTQRNIVILILYLSTSFSDTCIFKTLNILFFF